MDFVNIIQNKIEKLNLNETFSGIASVMLHIERAFLYFDNGINEPDNHYFNDVIYRTNQAYEGILKEAYKVFTQSDSNKVTPHKIEDYFSENQIFNERVKNLFSEYRKNWRNLSTHDHLISFTEEEAVLAINTVTSFIYLLINQIFEKIVYNNQMLDLLNQMTGRVNRIEKEFDEYVVDLIFEFASNHSTGNFDSTTKEYEIAGRLNAFLNYSDPEINVYREVTIGDKVRYRPDFILEKDGKKVIVELKTSLRIREEQAATDQLQTYLNAAKLNEGVLFVANTTDYDYNVKVEKPNIDGMCYRLTKIMPRTS